MKRSDKQVLKEIQKAAKRSLNTIHTISEKVYDDALALDLNRQALKYTEIENKTSKYLLSHKEKPYSPKAMDKVKTFCEVQAGTLLNTSTGHIAEMMILGNSKGMIQMYKTLSRNEDAGQYAMEMAKEFVDFEEKNIERLREYL